MWKIGIWPKNFIGAAILVLQWQGQNYYKRKIWNFPIPRLHTVQEKMLYHGRYSTDFQKLSICWKMWKIGIWAQKFHWRSYFSFAMVTWKLFSCGKNSKFPTFKLYTVSEKMLYHQRYSTHFQKLSFCWKMWENRYLAQKFHGCSYFSFAMVTRKLFSCGKIRNFPLSSCTLCQKKCYITKGIQPIFKNFPSAERCGE